MAVNKNFVVKNGLEVKSNLLVADTSLDSVGIGTSFIKEKLHVQGGIGATSLFVGGIGTVHVATGNTARYENLNVTGLGTIATLSSNSINVVSLNASGIVTANKYFGDGSTLTGVSVGVRTAGAVLGYGVTFLDIRGSGVSTAFFNTNVGIATLFFEGGGSGGSVSISSAAPNNPNNGDLWYSIDYGRTFVYYDEVELGVGSTSVWVDASPFNNGGQFIGAYGGTAFGAIGYTAGTASSTSIFFTGDPNTGIFQPTADQVSISAGGVGVATFNPGGFFVGGAATVTSDLSVSGNLNVTGDLVYDEERGANILISGVGTASGLNVLGISSTKDLNVVGVATIATLNVSTLNATSVTESENLTIQTGVTTNATNTQLTVTGVTTITDSKTQTGVTTNLTATNLTVTGIATIASGTITATSLTAATGVTTNATNTLLKVTGVSTFASAATFSDDVTFTGANYNVTWDKSVDDLIFGDNAKAAFGAASDLTIYHDSSHSFISDQGTGSLKVLSSDFQVNNAANAENMITASEDGAAALYYNGTSRIQTTNTGVNVTGTTTDDGATHDGDVTLTGASYNVTWDKSGNSLLFGDNAQLQLGTGGDLNLYHDGSNSYIQNSGTGNLIIYGTGETLATFADDGAVSLYYNNVRQMETFASGVQFDNNIVIKDSNKVLCGDGYDLQLYHNATNSYLQNSTGNLIIDNSSGVDMYINSGNDIYIRPQGSENGIKVIGDGAVELYHNGDLRLQTWSDGVNIHGDEGEDARLHLYADNGDDNADKWKLEAAASGSEFYIKNYASGGWETNLKAVGNGAVELYCDNALKFKTVSGGVRTNGNLELLDTHQIQLGTGSDFLIYHDGNNFIDSGATQLRIDTDVLRLRDNAGDHYLEADVNQGVKLFYNNVKKAETVTGGFTVTGTCTATAFAGDGSALTGLAAGGGEFNTGISEYNTISAVTTSMATAFTANSSSSHRTIIHSIRITNKTGSEVTISGQLYGGFAFAHLIPVPGNSSVELLKKPKVLTASQTIQLQASSGSALDAIIAGELQENTDLSYGAVDLSSTSTADIVTLSAVAVVESILLTNDDGTNDVKATVTWTNGSNSIQAYLSYELVVPAGASVELLERPLAMPSGHKLRATANIGNRCEVIAALKYAS